MQQHWKALAITALLLMPIAAFAAEDTFDKNLNVNGAVSLKVNTGSGYIHVTAGSDNQVRVIGHVHAGKWGWSNGGSPEERVKQVVANPPVEQTGNIITIGRHTDQIKNVSIDYDITAPKGIALEANSGSGDIRIVDLSGPARANTGSGSIDASGLKDRVSLEAGSGDIRAEMLSSTEVKAQTGSGNIRLRNVGGSLWADAGSGDIEVQGTPGSSWKLETGSGSVTLNTGTAGYKLDASTGSGSVHSDPPISMHGSLEHHHVMGDIHGGGPTVRVETGSGDIRIQ